MRNHKHLPGGSGTPSAPEGRGQAPVTVPVRAPWPREAVSKFPLAVAICNCHPRGPVLLTSSLTRAQRRRGPALQGPVRLVDSRADLGKHEAGDAPHGCGGGVTSSSQVSSQAVPLATGPCFDSRLHRQSAFGAPSPTLCPLCRALGRAWKSRPEQPLPDPGSQAAPDPQASWAAQDWSSQPSRSPLPPVANPS